MGILIVDDSEDQLLLLERLLNKADYRDIVLANSAVEALQMLKECNTASRTPDLILMDIVMPEVDGIEACYRIKEIECLKDTPIVMVTALAETEKLQLAFSAGAVDYITKPVKKVELLARVSSILRLKHEIDRRKAHEKELEELTGKLETANKMLERISVTDSLTDIANRRYFDEFMELEWLRAVRDQTPLSLVIGDVDFFKVFNDSYGHQAGDDCLKRVAVALRDTLKRPADIVARYGGEEFAAVLPGTDLDGAIIVAEAMRLNVEALGISYNKSAYLSKVSAVVTISLGVASIIPSDDFSPGKLISMADNALYKAKEEGRNRVRHFGQVKLKIL